MSVCEASVVCVPHLPCVSSGITVGLVAVSVYHVFEFVVWQYFAGAAFIANACGF